MISFKDLNVGTRVIIKIGGSSIYNYRYHDCFTLVPSRMLGTCKQDGYMQYCFLLPENFINYNKITEKEIARLKTYSIIRMLDNIRDYVGCSFEWTQIRTSSDFLYKIIQ
jgi:hypothetical protein